MTNSADIIARRKANALWSDARLSAQVVESMSRRLVRSGFLVGWLWPSVLHDGTERMRASQGGLWVGGDGLLSRTAIAFKPNGMNVKLHADPETLNIVVPLERLTSIRVRRAFITDIIDIETPDIGLSLRCFRAKQFAAEIEAASRKVRPSD